MRDLLRRALRPPTVLTDYDQPPDAWGWFPLLALISSVGILLVSTAYTAGRLEEHWGDELRWLGLVIIYLPLAWRAMQAQVSRRERLALVVWLGLLLYLVRYLYSPLEFQFGDEFAHWRSTSNALSTHHLFGENSLLPVGSYYPGLHNATVAIHAFTALPVFEAGVVLIGLGRVVFTIALFIFLERASSSHHIAALGSVLYVTHFHYIAFLGMFIYQALAIPLAMLYLALLVRPPAQRPPPYAMLFALMLIAATVITHHVTTYVLIGFMLLWVVVGYAMQRYGKRVIDHVPYPSTVFLLAFTLFWVLAVAPITLDYLGAPLTQAVNNIISVASGTQSSAEVYEPPAIPILERLLSFAAVGATSSILPLGAWYIWHVYRRRVLPVVLTVSAGGFYASLALRLMTTDGAQLAGRVWTFIYIAVGFVMAVGLIGLWRLFRANVLLRVAFPSIALLMFIGGLINGYPPIWGRLPGPYLVAAFERSIEPQGVETSHWFRNYAGTQNRIFSDSTNRDLLASFGMQQRIQGASWLVFANQFGEAELDDVNFRRAEFFILDRRLGTQLPRLGIYYEPGEPDANRYTEPLDLDLFDKFDTTPQIDRVYDSGDIQVYDMRYFITDDCRPRLDCDEQTGSPRASPPAGAGDLQWAPEASPSTAGWVWALVALPLVVWLPGFALVAIAYGDSWRPDPWMAAALSVGLSLAAAVIVGVLLDMIPWGLRRESWVIVLGGLTLVALVLAWRRGARLVWPAALDGARIRWAQGLLLAATLGVTAAAIAVGIWGQETQRERTTFTQFWMLPTAGLADSNDGDDGEDGADIVVGIRNHEDETVTYRIFLTTGAGTAHYWSDITLDMGETWENTLDDINDTYVAARLYRADQTTPYRYTQVWLSDR